MLVGRSFTNILLENWLGLRQLVAQTFALRCIFSPKAWRILTTKHEQQLDKVLRYLAGTLHYNLSLHTKIQIAKEKAKNIELLAFSASSWTRTCISTALSLWEVPLIASCKTACAQNEEEAELQSVRLALALASHTRKLLQQLDMDQLGKDVQIGVKTSSFNEELVDGRPIAMQLGLSRRNKH